MSGLLNLETALNSLAAGTSSAPFILGPVTFAGVEVPGLIQVGGKQVLGVSQLPGGDRVIQPMGPQPDNLEWSGLFIGPNALARAQQLVALRNTGTLIALSFAGYRFRVVIESFNVGVQQRGAVAPYRVVCVVQPTLPPPPDEVADFGAAQGDSVALTGQVSKNATAAASSLSTASDFGAATGDSISLLQSTATTTQTSTITSLAAAPAIAGSVSSNLQAAQDSTTALVASSGATLTSISAAAPPGSFFNTPADLQAAFAAAGTLAFAVQAQGFIGCAVKAAALARIGGV